MCILMARVERWTAKICSDQFNKWCRPVTLCSILVLHVTHQIAVFGPNRLDVSCPDAYYGPFVEIVTDVFDPSQISAIRVSVDSTHRVEYAQVVGVAIGGGGDDGRPENDQTADTVSPRFNPITHVHIPNNVSLFSIH